MRYRLLFIFLIAFPAVGFAQTQTQTQKQAPSDSEQCYKTADSDPDLAIQYCTAAINEGGSPPTKEFAPEYHNRALAYYRKGEYGKAMADINECLTIRPNYALSLWLRGEIERAQGNYDPAITDYKASVSIKKDYTQSYGGLAAAYEAKREYDLGIEAASEAIRTDPKYLYGYWIRSLIYQDKLDIADAVRDEDMAIQLAPKDVALYSRQADNYEYLGEWDKAKADIDKALQINPDNSWAVSDKAWMEWSQGAGDGDKAMADADKALLLSPGNYGALRLKAMIELSRKEYSAAGDDMAAAVAGVSDYYYGVLWLHIVRSHARVDDREELARNTAKLDLTVWPGPVMSYYMGKITKAQLLSQVETADPAQTLIRKCESTFYIGEDELAKGHLAEATTLFRRAQEICPGPYIEHTGAREELKMMPKPAVMHARRRRPVKH